MPVALTPAGHPLRVQWNGALDATDAEVAAATVAITPVAATSPMPELVAAPTGSPPELDVTVAAGRRIQALALTGLRTVKDGREVALTSSDDLSREGRTLVVSVPDAVGTFTPLYAVPPVPARGVLPPSLRGATFAGSVLTLNGLAASRLRLSIVEGSFPDYQRRDLRVTQVTGTAAIRPRGLELVDPAGTAVWAFPDELPPGAPPPVVDVRFALENALKAALADTRPTDVTFRLRGAAGTAEIAFAAPRGALVRPFPGVIRTELRGHPERLDLGPHPLANEQPVSATADVTVRYEGIRLLDRIQDAVPSGFGDVAGRAVGPEPVVRALPPRALDGSTVARVGVVGRAPEPCELSVQLVDLAAGEPLAPPAVVQLEPASAISTIWVAPEGLATIHSPVGVSARANAGSFLWAGLPDPRVRIAIFDADPGGRPLRLGFSTLCTVDRNVLELRAHALSAAAFRATAPALASELFLAVDVSDLTLRYAR